MVPGGRGVDDDGVVATGFRDPRQLEEAAQLVHAGQAQAEEAVDVGVVEVVPRSLDELQGSPAGPEPAGQGLVGVELQGIERGRRGQDARVTCAPTRRAEHVTQRVRRSRWTRRGVRRPAPAAISAKATAEVLLPTRPSHSMNSKRGVRHSGGLASLGGGAPPRGPLSKSSSPTTLASTPVTRKVPGGSARPCWRSRISSDPAQQLALGLGRTGAR